MYLWEFQDNMAASLEQSPATLPSVYNMDIYRIKVNWNVLMHYIIWWEFYNSISRDLDVLASH